MKFTDRQLEDQREYVVLTEYLSSNGRRSRLPVDDEQKDNKFKGAKRLLALLAFTNGSTQKQYRLSLALATLITVPTIKASSQARYQRLDNYTSVTEQPSAKASAKKAKRLKRIKARKTKRTDVIRKTKQRLIFCFFKITTKRTV